ncbi:MULTISPECIES: HDOD domain-containing protein [Undibacterium]|jgi:HD-like signal output (HDOD) protein|uniref:HDOD domain-containing protein n=1 Tax=Undibacterium umbellatum TaxID=2762300 RepID=A0ABR6ZAR4_9BURK|nr:MULTISPECIES: HDOD domain-containing protein [Undibacterium]MBC3908839.1 HDOD domain-containing protein [Undibacterium umbellatum]MDP1978574.1 HDOD domain-containing protein [Undibacterium sp.]
MNKSEALKSIVAQASKGDLVFPTNVNASLKIQQALDDPDCGIETAAKLVMTEPLMSARVVAIANSVAYNRFGGGVTNIRTAITILGFNTLRSVTAAVVMRQLSAAVSDPAIRAKMEALWRHSAYVAALAHLIARKVSKVDAETALFAGIVHEVGGFYLLSRAQEFPALLEIESSQTSPDALAETDETFIGRAVLNKLLVPKRVVSAVEALWYGMRVMPPETLGDTLVLANELAAVPSPLDPRSPENIRQSASEIDFAVGEGTLLSILSESAEEVDALTASLIS